MFVGGYTRVGRMFVGRYTHMFVGSYTPGWRSESWGCPLPAPYYIYIYIYVYIYIYMGEGTGGRRCTLDSGLVLGGEVYSGYCAWEWLWVKPVVVTLST